MNKSDIDRVQNYLRRLLGSEKVQVIAPARAGLSAEVAVDGEVIGTMHRDDDEGEVSFAVHLTILEEDLPPPPRAVPPKAPPRKAH